MISGGLVTEIVAPRAGSIETSVAEGALRVLHAGSVLTSVQSRYVLPFLQNVIIDSYEIGVVASLPVEEAVRGIFAAVVTPVIVNAVKPSAQTGRGCLKDGVLRHIIELVGFRAVASGTPAVGDVPALGVSDALSVLDAVHIYTAIAGICVNQLSCHVVFAGDCLS